MSKDIPGLPKNLGNLSPSRKIPGDSRVVRFEELKKDKHTGIITLKDFTIEDEKVEGQTLTINGKVFMIDLDAAHAYFHFMLDQIGEYEYLKSIDPEVTLLVVCRELSMMKGKKSINLNMYNLVSSVLSRYKIYNDSVIDLSEYSQINIESLVFSNKDFNKYLRNAVYFKPGVGLRQKAVALKNSKIAKANKKEDQKIYICRRNENARNRRILARKEMSSLDAIREQKEDRLRSKGKDVEIKLKYRLVSEEDENKIESFFVERGYKVVVLNDMPLQDQVDLFYNATHVAAFKSASTTNSIFSKPGTKVFMLNCSNKYDFPHEEIAETVGCKVYSIPEYKSLETEDTILFSGEDMINSLLKYDDIL